MRTVEASYEYYMRQYRYLGDAPECQWNGPIWPYQTTQVLIAMANLLDHHSLQGPVTRSDYMRLLRQYTALHYQGDRLDLEEDYHPETGKPIVGLDRSHHYFHSGYNDLILGGLVGIRPRADDVLEVNPLLPDAGDPQALAWFRAQDVPYHGHRIAVTWDADGSHYGRGKGLSVEVNGKVLHASTSGEPAKPHCVTEPPKSFTRFLFHTSAPFAVFITNPEVRAGDIGVPAAGMELKLVETDGKTEVRYRGPNITPGYWRMPEETAESFDEEGFFKTGDAVLWIDPSNLHLGLKFDGRIAEDFKLATGTFVSVGPMRGKIIAAGAPYVQDVVLTGLNMKEVGAMVFPTPAVRTLSGLGAQAPLADVLASVAVQAHFQTVVNELARSSTGSANRIARLCLLSDPPTIDRGEITDKGSINQRAVLTHRADTVAALHADQLHHIIKPTV